MRISRSDALRESTRPTFTQGRFAANGANISMVSRFCRSLRGLQQIPGAGGGARSLGFMRQDRRGKSIIRAVMRIVAWNCQMGFDKKVDALRSLNPDLAVISECSQKSALALRSHGYETLWFGSNVTKGMAVLCSGGWGIEAIQEPEQQWIVPIRVDAGAMSFTLIAVWACRVGNRKADQYIGQVNQALLSHPQWLSSGPVVLAGDFNSNQIWDPERPSGNHSSVVRLLERNGIVSGYHRFFMEDQGKESRPTAYLYRHHTRPYHIDYIFIPEKWATALKSVDVGEFSNWSRHSDHCPVVVELLGAEQS